MMANNPTNADVMRQIEKLEGKIDSLPDKIDRTYVRVDVYEADERTRDGVMASILFRVDKMESWGKWLAAIVIGAVVVAVLRVVLEKG